MEDMLAKHADLNAVFCENDSMCLGAQKAIADAGKAEQIFITSVDGEKGALKEIMTRRRQLRRHRPQQLRPDRPRRLQPR